MNRYRDKFLKNEENVIIDKKIVEVIKIIFLMSITTFTDFLKCISDHIIVPCTHGFIMGLFPSC